MQVSKSCMHCYYIQIYRLWLQFRLRACKQTPRQNYTQNQYFKGCFVKLSIYRSRTDKYRYYTQNTYGKKLLLGVNFRTHLKENITLLPESLLDDFRFGGKFMHAVKPVALDKCCVEPGNSSFGFAIPNFRRMAEKREGSTQPQCQKILTLSSDQP